MDAVWIVNYHFQMHDVYKIVHVSPIYVVLN